MIHFVDLKAQYLTIKNEMDTAMKQVMDETAFVGGKYVSQFEQEFANYIGTKHCIGCANGTDTMEIILQAYGIGRGDEVIVPAHTWVSTAEVVANVGATPIFVDTLEKYFTIDPTKIEAKISSKTKAIIPVHLCGLPAEMDEIMDIAQKHNLVVIEDCAQAHGAEYKGKRVGTIGHAGSFSFYPGKNLGAYGDGGGITTNDDAIAEKCRIIGNHGQKAKHEHLVVGRNSRLDGLQAAVLSVKLKYLDQWNASRAKNADVYNSLLKGNLIATPSTPEYSKHVFHLYMIRVNDRDSLMKKLAENQVFTGIHYPHVLPSMPAFFEENHQENYPVSSEYCQQIVSLPMFAELTQEQIEKVCELVNEFA